MKIGLWDVDSLHFPNLALMKLSAHHKTLGDSVERVNFLNEYDLVYKSKVFSFTEEDKQLVETKKLQIGGIGYGLYNSLPDNIEHICPDYSLYNCNEAYGFLTRGCIRNCPWCIVPQKEGDIKAHADISEFIGNKKSAILMDNNVLAIDYGLNQIEKIVNMGIKIDFNQGLDARIIANSDSVSKLLSKIRWLKPLRMACDTKSSMSAIKQATEKLHKYGCTPSNYFVYVLVKDIEDAYERVIFLDALGLDPFAQPYRDFTNNGVIDEESKNFARWVNHKAIFRSVPWKEYRKHIDKETGDLFI